MESRAYRKCANNYPRQDNSCPLTGKLTVAEPGAGSYNENNIIQFDCNWPNWSRDYMSHADVAGGRASLRVPWTALSYDDLNQNRIRACLFWTVVLSVNSILLSRCKLIDILLTVRFATTSLQAPPIIDNSTFKDIQFASILEIL